jgi:NadR type nicotinamide-nucleotide adenylyltransferase
MGMKTIVLTGPESTGKTALASRLASHFRCLWVPEYAREFLEKTKGKYDFHDLSKIAAGQLKWKKHYQALSPEVLIQDTDLLTIYIWSQFKYGKVDEWVGEQLEEQRSDLYLLCHTDLPWEADPLRENPEEREELLSLYRSELIRRNWPFVSIEGMGEHRFSRALNSVKESF